VPQHVAIYYADYALGPDISIHGSEIFSFKLPESDRAQADVIQVEIDGQWAFIQVQGIVILNRLGGAKLPDVLLDLSRLAGTATSILPKPKG
jgi:hypothetical protein